MVVGYDEIKKALESNEIEITKYEYSSDKEKISRRKYCCSDLEESHKIQLHVGFLLRTLSYNRWLNPKILYQKRDGIIDLRKSPDNTYFIKSGESVILYTNEFVKLSANYFGLLLPKVRYGGTGLSISASYVDPSWRGVVQLIVTNHSELSQPLKECCEIANLVLIKANEPINKINESESDHFSLTWERIFDNPIFPKWHNRQRNLFLRFRHRIRTKWTLFAALGFAAIIAIVKFAMDFYRFVIDVFGPSSTPTP